MLAFQFLLFYFCLVSFFVFILFVNVKLFRLYENFLALPLTVFFIIIISFAPYPLITIWWKRWNNGITFSEPTTQKFPFFIFYNPRWVLWVYERVCMHVYICMSGKVFLYCHCFCVVMWKTAVVGFTSSPFARFIKSFRVFKTIVWRANMLIELVFFCSMMWQCIYISLVFIPLYFKDWGYVLFLIFFVVPVIDIVSQAFEIPSQFVFYFAVLLLFRLKSHCNLKIWL